ncbi:MAG: S41 family peptidase [Lachnospiraceae bacterium]|nr:S41 family peptidase [Lachnospiraceae bacterium]
MEENNIVNETNKEIETESITELTSDEIELLLHNERRSGIIHGAFVTVFVFAIITVIMCIVFAFAGGTKQTKSDLLSDAVVKKTNYLWSMIGNNFLWEKDVDIDKAVDGMYKGMLNSLEDPYSVYYTKEEFADLMEDSSGEYSGIGAYISQDITTKESFISRPMPGSPAEEAGLVANDYIIEVDGEDVLGLDLNIIVSKIKGPEGTTVDITVKHENAGEPEVITVERRKIEVARLESEMIGDDIGYIWLYEFEGNTYEQFNKAYDSLKSEGMKGLIIDLRDNPGGDLSVVVKLADKFIGDGKIVYTKERNGKGSVYKANPECEKLPIVIITNENSASASEIFTGSLKDHGVAAVVGKNTFGKGIVQGLYGLSDGSGVKITESEYYLPNDECIHGVGIAPDYEVDLDIKAYKKDKSSDAQKKKAIEVMKELLKK